MEPNAQEYVQRERRRLGQVRKSYEAGVAARDGGASVSVEFFSACVDYIRASMDRLHRQDQHIHDLLKPHLKSGDKERAATLENLNMRLARSRTALADLVTARDAFRGAQTFTGGDTGWSEFKNAIAAFMEVYFNVLMKGQHSTLEFQHEVFKPGDWGDVAGINEAALLVEATTFAQVRKFAPANADPATFKAGPPPTAPKAA
ncbi:MAG: hypothetical protein KDE14_03705 [Rhodobacteraceae bacterium]|nr:hypothetical protein [Paracoccaceae bacterium]